MSFLKNGHATFLTFGNSSIATLKEITVKPPGIDGGGEIDTTTMHNTTYMTAAPKSLKKLTEAKATCSFDPLVLNDILAQVQVNQLITLHYPNGKIETFYGFIDKFDYSDHKIGERPTADLTIVCTMTNTSDVETAPTIA